MDSYHSQTFSSQAQSPKSGPVRNADADWLPVLTIDKGWGAFQDKQVTILNNLKKKLMTNCSCNTIICIYVLYVYIFDIEWLNKACEEEALMLRNTIDSFSPWTTNKCQSDKTFWEKIVTIGYVEGRKTPTNTKWIVFFKKIIGMEHIWVCKLVWRVVCLWGTAKWRVPTSSFIYIIFKKTVSSDVRPQTVGPDRCGAGVCACVRRHPVCVTVLMCGGGMRQTSATP